MAIESTVGGRAQLSQLGSRRLRISGRARRDEATLIEYFKVGGHGLGGVLTQTGKQRIDLDGRSFLLETALRADFAPVQAFLADYLGSFHPSATGSFVRSEFVMRTSLSENQTFLANGLTISAASCR